MLLRGPKQTRLSLLFGRPHHEGDWLSVTLNASVAGANWSAKGQYMVSGDVQRLAQWLDAVAGKDEKEKDIEFMEPEISFAICDSETRILRVALRWKVRPPWPPHNRIDDEPFYIDFPAEEKMLKIAAQSLYEQIASWDLSPT